MSLLRRGRHRKKKMPESFPLVIMGFAVLIGITGIGFFLSPGPSEEPPYSAQTPYSASPSEKGTETPRVTPTPKTSSTASKPSGSATKPVTRKPSATPKPSTTPKPTTTPKPPTTKPEPPKPDPVIYDFIVEDSSTTICNREGPGLHDLTGVKYYSFLNDKNPATATAKPSEIVTISVGLVACPTPPLDIPDVLS